MAFNPSTKVAYYVARLAYQYKKPKAQQQIALWAKQMVGDDLPEGVNRAYNFPGAVGAQLDIIGKYVGIPRNIGLPDAKPYFKFARYASGAALDGFRRYASDINIDAIWYRYSFSGGENTDLTDAQYELMIRLKIALNSCDNTLASIVDVIRSVFPGTVTVVDNKDMTLTYNVLTTAPIPAAVLEPYLPKPMGVGINALETDSIITADGDHVVTEDGDRIVIG